ncbi:MAG: hypothetical protein EAY69_00420 [Cytophagales bacterium]|nr:MAG: hypothetical protein EAY69_00420 [Cytophagales bacterium]
MLQNFEKKLKDLAENTEIPYNPEDWKLLSARLHHTNKKWTIWKRVAMVAASLLFLSIPTYFVLNDAFVTKEITYINQNNKNNQNNSSNNYQKTEKNNQNNQNNSINKKNIDENKNTQDKTSHYYSGNNTSFLVEKSNIIAVNVDKKTNERQKNNDKINEDKNNIITVVAKENKNKFELLQNEIFREEYTPKSITIISINQKEQEQNKQKKSFGLINYAETKGTQVALFANINRQSNTEIEINPENTPILQKRDRRIQIAGFINHNGQNYQDKQFALIANKANTITKLQTSTFFNDAKTLEGTQVGLINRAKIMKGRQFGLINIADSAQGTPIGLITIVALNGFQQLELNVSEIFQTNVSYKLGTKKFYNTFSFATGYSEPDIKWAIGYGFGRKFQFNEKNSAHLDFSIYHLNKGNRWTRELNEILQLKFNYHIKLTKSMTAFAGPTLNLFISDVKSPDLNFNGFIPYSIFQGYIGNSSAKSWLGANIGIAF